MTDEFWDKDVDTKPWDEIVAWQRSQLGGFLDIARTNSPLYAERLSGVDVDVLASTERWADVPFTAKADLRTVQQQPTTERVLGDIQCAADDEIVQILASSGTTGTPVYFGLTEQDRQAWSDSIANMFFTAGVRRGSVVALTTGMPLVAGGMPYADAVRRIGASLVWVGGQTPARMAGITADLKVDTLIGTASFATFFAARCTEVLGHPASDLPVRTVIAGGEPGLGEPTIRNRVLDDWGADRVSEVMGLGDVLPGMWGECPDGRGMHFTAARNVFVELIDPSNGEPVAWRSGASGEAVYTPFTRRGTPVVRFRSQDHLEVVDTDCACGRTSPLVRCVGRTDDMLIYKAMNVFPSAIRDVVMDAVATEITGPMRMRKSREDQVRFDQPIPLEVELDANAASERARELGHRIDEAVRHRLRVRVAVEFVAPGSIPVGEYKNALTYVA